MLGFAGDRDTRKLSRKLGVTPTSINRWESGESISELGQVKLARAIGRPFEVLKSYLAGEIELTELLPSDDEPIRSQSLQKIQELMKELPTEELVEVLVSAGIELRARFPDSAPKTLQELVATHWDVLIDDPSIPSDSLNRIRNGLSPSDSDIVRISSALSLPSDFVKSLARKNMGEGTRNGETNPKPRTQ